MATFNIPVADGTYTKDLVTGKFHDIAVKPKTGTMTGGTLIIKCRAIGMKIYRTGR